MVQLIENYVNLNGRNLKLKLRRSESLVDVSILIKHHADLFYNSLSLVTISFINLIALNFNILSFKIVAIVFLCMIGKLMLLSNSVQEENLLIVKNIGIQVTTSYTVGKKTVFIPYELVQNVFINEVIYSNKIIYLLTLITKDTLSGSTCLVPLFLNTMPRLKCLQKLYRHLKLLLQREDSNEINKNLRIPTCEL